MEYISHYHSPLGDILLAAEQEGLTGLWFAGQARYARSLGPQHEAGELPLLTAAKRWLDCYFAGQEPSFTLPLLFKGSPFQKAVWALLCTIPYGHTTTYGELARRLAAQQGWRRMAPQAVGGAVARNNISIMVPCHRVVGRDGSLTGYAAGLEKKSYLLRLEQVRVEDFFIHPHRATP